MRTTRIELLEFLGLADKRDAKASDLPYGDQRRLEMARALATQPRLLLLDEPAAGMNPHETEELDELITRIRDRGVTIILVEHDMRLVMEHFRPRYRAQLRHQDRRGHAEGDSAQSGGDRSLSRRGRAAMSMLAINGLRSGYGKIEVLHDVGLDDRAGTDRHADRRQRRRQDDAAEDDLRPDPADRRQRSTFEGKSIARRPAAQDRRAGHQPGAGRPRHPQAHDRDRQPAHGRLRAQRFRDRAATSRRSSRAFPRWRSGGSRSPARSAAASSRCWRSAARLSHGRASCCSTSRRWVLRPSSSPDFPDAARAQEGGQDHPPGRAKRPPGAAGRRPRLCAWSADASSTADRERNCSTCPRCSARISGNSAA